jgi:hypothetical protein
MWGVAILVLCPVGLRAENPELKKFTSKGGSFTVLLPEGSKTKTQSQKSPIGELKVTRTEGSLGGTHFGAIYTDFPADRFKDADPARVLDGARNGAVQSLKGKLVSEKEIALGKARHPGRELLVEAAGGKVWVRARIYLAGNRLYQTIASGTEEAVKARIVDRFLDSLTLTALPADGSEWKTFTSREGKYKALLPSGAKTKTQSVKTEIGPVKVVTTEAALEGTHYMVVYADYPADRFKDADPDKVLDGVRGGAVKEAKGKLVSEKKITLGKARHPGRDLLIETLDGKARVRQRIYLVRNRLYQILAIGTEEAVKARTVDKFHESFTLTERPDAGKQGQATPPGQR